MKNRRRNVWALLATTWASLTIWHLYFEPSGKAEAYAWIALFLVAMIVSMVGLADAWRIQRLSRDYPEGTEERMLGRGYVRREMLRLSIGLIFFLAGAASVVSLDEAVIPLLFGGAHAILAGVWHDWIDRHEREALRYQRKTLLDLKHGKGVR